MFWGTPDWNTQQAVLPQPVLKGQTSSAGWLMPVAGQWEDSCLLSAPAGTQCWRERSATLSFLTWWWRVRTQMWGKVPKSWQKSPEMILLLQTVLPSCHSADTALFPQLCVGLRHSLPPWDGRTPVHAGQLGTSPANLFQSHTLLNLNYFCIVYKDMRGWIQLNRSCQQGTCFTVIKQDWSCTLLQEQSSNLGIL